MTDTNERRSEFGKAVRHGMGWALGVGVVVGAGSAVTRGGAATVKGAMKTLLRAREAGAELAERVQDVYAAAQSEYAAERLADEHEHEHEDDR